MLTCCGAPMITGKRDGFTVYANCRVCHHGPSEEKLEALQAREMHERLDVLKQALVESYPTCELALTGKSLEEVINIDTPYGLSAKSLEDLEKERGASEVALEDIFREDDV